LPGLLYVEFHTVEVVSEHILIKVKMA